MTTIASQIFSLTVVYSTVYSDADQRKHQSSAPLAFVWGIHRDRWIPRTKGQLRGKCFHLMTSSWADIEQKHMQKGWLNGWYVGQQFLFCGTLSIYRKQPIDSCKYCSHHSDVTWGIWCLDLLTMQLFVRLFTLTKQYKAPHSVSPYGGTHR